MKKQLDRKIINGKLLRVEIDIDDDLINSIKITGDFFVHPETALAQIELFLEGKKLCEVRKGLNQFIKENNIQLIGFSVQDISILLEEASQ